MARQFSQLPVRLAIAFLIGAPSVFPETHAIWKSAQIEARVAHLRGIFALHSGPGYTIRIKAMEKEQRSATGEPVDQMVWIRRGAGHLSLARRRGNPRSRPATWSASPAVPRTRSNRAGAHGSK